MKKMVLGIVALVIVSGALVGASCSREESGCKTCELCEARETQARLDAGELVWMIEEDGRITYMLWENVLSAYNEHVRRFPNMITAERPPLEVTESPAVVTDPVDINTKEANLVQVGQVYTFDYKPGNPWESNVSTSTILQVSNGWARMKTLYCRGQEREETEQTRWLLSIYKRIK